MVNSNGTESTISQLLEVDCSTQLPVADISDSIARATQWLKSNQLDIGCWGNDTGERVWPTSRGIWALNAVGEADSQAVRQALMYLRGQYCRNTQELAKVTDTLQLLGQDVRGYHIRLDLRANWGNGSYIRGWGMQPRFYPDAFTTALAIRARDNSEFPLPTPDGNTYSRQSLTEGNIYERYWLKSLDGHYGWVPKAEDSLFVSAFVYDVLYGVGDYDWVYALQETNGSFKDSILDTAAVLLWLPLDGSIKTDAEDYLITQQSPDGSWDTNPFVTSLCLEALAKETISFEAEDNYTISNTLVEEYDASASEVYRVRNTTAHTTAPSDDNDGVAVYQFQVTSDGVYEVWAVVKLDSTGDPDDHDMFWIKMDSQAYVKTNIPHEINWVLDKFSNDSVSTPKNIEFELSQGQHELRIGAGDAGAMLDKIIIQKKR